jgi:hypothetical protein
MAEEQSKNKPDSTTRSTLMVRACIIHDGTTGVSLSMGGKLIGEWADSRAKTLSLTDEGEVAIQGSGGERLYLFSVSGGVISCEQLSATEVAITFET